MLPLLVKALRLCIDQICTYLYRFLETAVKTGFLVQNRTFCVHLNNLRLLCFRVISFIVREEREIIAKTIGSVVPFLYFSAATPRNFHRWTVHLTRVLRRIRSKIPKLSRIEKARPSRQLGRDESVTLPLAAPIPRRKPKQC